MEKKSRLSLESINPLYIDDLEKRSHHSSFVKENDYNVLIIRRLELSEEGLGFQSIGFIIDGQNQVYLYKRDTKSLEVFEPGLQGLYTAISPIYARNQKIIEQFVTEIDQLEDSLFERRASRIFMDIWFDLKKDYARIERHFFRNGSVLKEFYKHFSGVEGFEEAEFRDLLEQIQQYHNSAANQLSRLDALYNYYNSIKNDRLNKNIFMLTLLSAVFLPLNLIVGFFGMNTQGLFFSDDAFGTQKVLLIVLGSLLLSIFGLPLIRFLDHHILRFFLGRYHIYKKISGKLDKILKLD